MSNKDGRIRKNVEVGTHVQIVLKEDQKSGHLTKGVVKEILTNSAKHPHGIKVKIKSGPIGRVRKVLSKPKQVFSRDEDSEDSSKDKTVYNVPFLNY